MDTDVVCRAQGWAKGELLFSWKQELNVAKTLDSPGYIRGGPWPLGAPVLGVTAKVCDGEWARTTSFDFHQVNI